MEIELYSSKAEKERVDKKKYITKIGNSLEGDLIESTSMYNYVIKLPLTNERLNANYIHIVDSARNLNKYCYIDDKIWIAGNIYQIICSVDPLMTYKDDIYKQKAILASTEHLTNSKDEKIGNKYYNNGVYKNEERTFSKIIEFPDLFSDGFGYIVTTVGGFPINEPT